MIPFRIQFISLLLLSVAEATRLRDPTPAPHRMAEFFGRIFIPLSRCRSPLSPKSPSLRSWKCTVGEWGRILGIGILGTWTMEEVSNQSVLTHSAITIFAAEFGDKTFFINCILAMTHSPFYLSPVFSLDGSLLWASSLQSS